MKNPEKSSIVPFLSKQFIPFLFSYRCNNISSCFRIICALIENSFWRCIMEKKISTRLLYVGLFVALTPDIFNRVHLHFSKKQNKKTLYINLFYLHSDWLCKILNSFREFLICVLPPNVHKSFVCKWSFLSTVINKYNFGLLHLP